MMKPYDYFAAKVAARIATVLLCTCSAGNAVAAQGDVLGRFDPMDNWATGLAFDFSSEDRVYLFHQSNLGLGVMSTAAPHELAVVPTSKIGPQDYTGGSIDPATGRIYASDFDGDIDNIDDNIHLFAPDGTTLAFWETHVGRSGPPCTAGFVDQILDVAMDHAVPGRVYATSVLTNVISVLDLSNTSGGSTSPSPCSVVGTLPVPPSITNVAGIEYDPCNDGYWLSDFESGTIVLVDNDGSFTTVRETLVFDASPGRNRGITPVPGRSGPIELWTVDFTADLVTRLDSGTESCCDPMAENCCDPAPRNDCRQAQSSSLSIVDDLATDAKDRLAWKWQKGAVTGLDDLADPTASADFLLCLYGDESGFPIRADVTAGGSCSGKPCWKATGTTGFQFKDALGARDGITGVRAKAGVEGKAGFSVKGKGARLASRVPLGEPVAIQVTNTQTGVCWGSTFDGAAISKNGGRSAKQTFKAKAVAQ